MSQNNLKLGVIGAGFVGGSVINGFDKNVDMFVVDTKLHPENTIDQLIEFKPTITFICVPTPKAIAPKAPCVEVCESPQTIVIPGLETPNSGPTT